MDDGLDEILRNLQALPRDMAKDGPSRKGLAAAARVVRDDARRRVPVGDHDGAHLRDQIITYRQRKGLPRGVDERFQVAVRFKARKYKNNKANRRLGRVGKRYAFHGDFFYWRHLEFGTSNHPPIPFLRPAFEANKAAMLEAFKREAKRDITRLQRKYCK